MSEIMAKLTVQYRLLLVVGHAGLVDAVIPRCKCQIRVTVQPRLAQADVVSKSGRHRFRYAYQAEQEHPEDGQLVTEAHVVDLIISP